MLSKINMYKKEKISKEKILETFQDWNAYAKWAKTYKLRNVLTKNIEEIFKHEISAKEVNKHINYSK